MIELFQLKIKQKKLWILPFVNNDNILPDKNIMERFTYIIRHGNFVVPNLRNGDFQANRKKTEDLRNKLFTNQIFFIWRNKRLKKRTIELFK